MADSTMSWHMQPDGTYVLHTKDDEGRPLVDSQEYLIRKHQRRPNSHGLISLDAPCQRKLTEVVTMPGSSFERMPGIVVQRAKTT